MIIRYHIYHYRNKKSMTLKELSALSGISKTQINEIENGKANPTVYTICKLAAALEVQANELFSVSD